MMRSWPISHIADLISEDPDIIDYRPLTLRYSDRQLSYSIIDDFYLVESISPDVQYDTIGELDHDYPIFMDSLSKNTDNIDALTIYSEADYAAKDARLFKLKGVNAGFAVAGDGDIISVHNSEPKGSPHRGIGRMLIKLAKQEGGYKLDHFDFPKLNEIYSAEGFEEVARYPWDDRYAPPNWNYDKYGTPDLIYREL